MTINEAQDAVIEEFEDFTDWMDKYQMLIDLGNELEPLDEKYKNEQNLIDGCQSRVWLQCDNVDGKLVFTADSDALIQNCRDIIFCIIDKRQNGSNPDNRWNASALHFCQHLDPTLCIADIRL